jgi:selenocysteine-specific elongation factor
MLVATAGHVDHGKTLLIKRLTGVDTDRLPEEKDRGLSIDLGFAYQTLESGNRLGFVDVPGHERFVRNMLAGVAAIDYALLVVAADDGPMPQTREHLAILDLLGIDHGAIAISKIDLVDPERVEEVRQLVKSMVSQTKLADAPVYQVSAMSGEGIEPLREHLRTLGDEHFRRPRGVQGSKFRLAIDRDFSVRGAGLVVTGAVFSGAVDVGDRLRLMPADIEVRVRALHAQSAPAEHGEVGERCALNIAGGELSRTTVNRGDWLVGEPAGEPSRRIDSTIRVLNSETKPMAHWTPVHVHLGAASLTGRVALLEERSLAPGESGLAQLVLDEVTLCTHGDRFIIRDQSARRTIAGGQVIDPVGAQKGRARPERLAFLRALDDEDANRALARLLEQQSGGIDPGHFIHAWNLTEEEAAALFREQHVQEIALRRRKVAMTRERWAALLDTLCDGLERWHADYPERIGPDEFALRLALELPQPRDLVTAAVQALVREGRMTRQGTCLVLPGHAPKLSQKDAELWKAVESLIKPDELKPPVVTDIANQLNMRKEPLVAFLSKSVGRGQLVRVAPNRFYHPRAIRSLADMAEALGQSAPDGAFDAKSYRDRSGIGRNLTIQVLEYFDVAGLTRRIGDTRRIIKSAEEVFGNRA